MRALERYRNATALLDGTRHDHLSKHRLVAARMEAKLQRVAFVGSQRPNGSIDSCIFLGLVSRSWSGLIRTTDSRSEKSRERRRRV